jgi:ABC-type dipeptide/oligopeptide/nickel transport system ATPase subunit
MSAEDLVLAPALEVAHLSVSFGRGSSRVDAVIDVSFAVAEGEIYGIVGESGSGKSAILKAIAGLNQHWTGAIRMRRYELGRRRPKRFQKLIQMVFQDPYGSLHPRQTVDRMLYEGLVVQDMGDRERRILRTLYDVGLPANLRFCHPHQLSGGQRQRAAIARALILEPRILLLDEPTSALDVSVQAEILNLLRQLRRQRQLSCILVSHNLAVISHMCDRLAVMNAGRLVEELDVAALREGAARMPYTQRLIRASRGYDPAVAAGFVACD